jgi:hypothetical protein
LEPYQGKFHLLLEEEAADRRKQKTFIQAVKPIKKKRMTNYISSSLCLEIGTCNYKVDF